MKLSYKRCTLEVPLWTLRLLKARMRYVRAAGGIVCDENGEVLLILRNGRWDLPKGKVEENETLLQAALREVEEETGIKPSPALPGNTVGQESVPVKTYHIYNLYGGWHLKQTSWFRMQAAGIHPQGLPQQEEGISATEWVPLAEARRRLQDSYGTLRTLSHSL